MRTNDFENLLHKYHQGKCTTEEKALVETFYLNHDFSTKKLQEDELNLAGNRVFDKINESTKIKKSSALSLSARITTIAAAIIILLGVGTLIFTNHEKLPYAYSNDVPPGTDKAILTLTNGKKINLSEAKDGSLTKQSGIELTKASDGTLIYKVDSSNKNFDVLAYNTITTPKGGQYKIVLSDGTKVWLNAASSLSYNASLYERGGARRIKMSGEAYFEVTKNKKHPFIVITDRQEVKVLGTHFNISAYNDERSIKTTLVEGSVHISPLPLKAGGSPDLSIKGVTIKPNQEAILSPGGIQVHEVNADEAVAWKNNEFTFATENLESIMRKIARWYDVDIIYASKQVGNKPFSGTISKFEKVSQVLCLLEVTGEVKFKIEGRRITVMD
ncbi:ferric-dicitrate binding protein FerR (iron transport regulator) [Pedobacter sp. AK017]|nr:ferric-dicitrate binding protein FerR (iron transport regulator) [Pedobacter sp. AK017]